VELDGDEYEAALTLPFSPEAAIIRVMPTVFSKVKLPEGVGSEQATWMLKQLYTQWKPSWKSYVEIAANPAIGTFVLNSAWKVGCTGGCTATSAKRQRPYSLTSRKRDNGFEKYEEGSCREGAGFIAAGN